MGYQFQAKCLDCGSTFTVRNGGGFFFHLLHCDRCGQAKGINFDELGELHVRYVKGLGMPYSSASKEHDWYIQEHSPVEPISGEEYYRRVEAVVGKCICGGNYTFDALPRCPQCHSTRFDDDGSSGICYD